MIAYAEMTEAAIWVQTTKEARVELSFRPAAQTSGAWRRTSVIRTTDAGDHIALFRLTSLPFGTKFAYRLHINGAEVSRPYPLEFTTQPHWRWRTDPPAFRFLIGSCAYTTDPVFDRPGTPFGGDYEIFPSMVKEKPDFMVWMGDNFYYREPDWLTESAMRYRVRYDRTQAYYQPLLAACPHYATWDDHDFGPNNSDRTFRMREEALKVFNDYFPSVARCTREAAGCFFRFEWADVEFFMLDDRFHRTPNDLDGSPDAQMLGPGQLAWLKESLASSLATFKIVVNGSQMVNQIASGEGFNDFPSEQKSLLDFVAAKKIRGVLFLSGDRHAGELLKVQWPGMGYPLYEFTSSPLSAGASRGSAREADHPDRVPGTRITEKRNYGVIEVSGPQNARVLVMLAKDKDGRTLWKHQVTAAELREPQRQ